MERAGRPLCAGWEDGAHGELGCEELPWSQPLGARRGSLGMIGFVPRRWRSPRPRKTEGARGVSFGSSELCTGSWILSLPRKGRWPLALLFSPASPDLLASSGDSWLERSGGQTQRRSPFPPWSVASFPGLAIFIPDVAAEGAGVG